MFDFIRICELLKSFLCLLETPTLSSVFLHLVLSWVFSAHVANLMMSVFLNLLAFFSICNWVYLKVAAAVELLGPPRHFLFINLRPIAHSASLSIPEFRSPSHGGNLNRSASLSCTERTPESGSVGGSNNQIPGTPFQYIPDFCVRALTDVQFVKVRLFLTGARSVSWSSCQI